MSNYRKHPIAAGQLIATILSFVLVWAFFSGNYFNEDYYNYVYAFEQGLDRFTDLNIEPVFALITHSFQQAGINDFYTFRSIIAFVFMLPFWYVLYSKSDKPLWSIIIYVPLFLLNIVILRNFMAFSIVLIGMLFLFKGGGKNKILFVFFLLFAEGIHNLMFIYLILLFIDLDIKILKKPFLYFAIVCILGVLTSAFISETIESLNTTKYSLSGIGRNIRVVLGIPILINYLILNYIYNNSKESGEVDVRKFEQCVLRVNYLMMAVVCFFPININASRLYLNLLVLNSVFISNRLLRHKKNAGVLIPFSFLYIFVQWYYMSAMVLGIQFDELFKYNYFINTLF